MTSLHEFLCRVFFFKLPYSKPGSHGYAMLCHFSWDMYYITLCKASQSLCRLCKIFWHNIPIDLNIRFGSHIVMCVWVMSYLLLSVMSIDFHLLRIIETTCLSRSSFFFKRKLLSNWVKRSAFNFCISLVSVFNYFIVFVHIFK